LPRKSNNKQFRYYLKEHVIGSANKIKEKFPPISEVVNKKKEILKIKTIYDLRGIHSNIFLLVAKSKSQSRKTRYFLATSLASQSSDLLVELAKDYALEHSLKLLQYSLHPKNFRTNLLILCEIMNSEEYLNSIKLLQTIWQDFRKKIVKIKEIIDNE